MMISMKYDINELLTKMDRIENGHSVSHFHDKDIEIDELWNFPITTIEEVNLFENKLTEKSFRSKIVINFL